MPCGCCTGCGRCVIDGQVNPDYRTREECEHCACLEAVAYDCEGPCPEGTWPVDQPQPSLEIYNSPCFDPGPYGPFGPDPWTAGATAECGAIVSVGEAIGGIFYPVFARLGRVAPTVTAAVSWGSGASLSVSLEVTQDECGFGYWRIAAVDVVAPGSGYSNGQSVLFHVADGDTVMWSASAAIAVGNGAVVGVTIGDRGAYYRESASAAPYVATPTVKIIDGGAGSGADFQVNIDTDPTSESFGRISSVTVLDGGFGYGSICAQAVPVGNCAACGEAPCSKGCPCGTWVVDSNQEPCECCRWELSEGIYAVAVGPGADQEYLDYLEAEGDALREKLNRLRDDLEAAGWTVEYDDDWDGDGFPGPEYPDHTVVYGFKLRAECPECERAYPRPIRNPPNDFSIEFWHEPCDKDQWVETPGEAFFLVSSDWIIAPVVFGCRNADGTWRNWPTNSSADGYPIFGFPNGYRGGYPFYYGSTDSGGTVWIPKCGQRITECVCCYSQNPDEPDQVTQACSGACPEGYIALYFGSGACAPTENPFP